MRAVQLPVLRCVASALATAKDSSAGRNASAQDVLIRSDKKSTSIYTEYRAAEALVDTLPTGVSCACAGCRRAAVPPIHAKAGSLSCAGCRRAAVPPIHAKAGSLSCAGCRRAVVPANHARASSLSCAGCRLADVPAVCAQVSAATNGLLNEPKVFLRSGLFQDIGMLYACAALRAACAAMRRHSGDHWQALLPITGSPGVRESGSPGVRESLGIRESRADQGACW